MELKVYSIDGKETSRKVTLPADIFGAQPNDHAIYLDVKQYLANQRQGTHKSKDKSEVSYSTKKIKRQKGTGGARAGSIKSGVFVGGGRIHGPRPRNYSFKLNKKLKRLARVSALSYKAQNNNIIVLENIQMEKPNTKQYYSVLKSLNVDSSRTLLVTPNIDKNIYLSGRNINNSRVMPANEINTYEILKAKNLILFEGSVDVIKETLNN